MSFDPETGYTPTPQNEFLDSVKAEIKKLYPNANVDDLTDLGVIANVLAYTLGIDENSFNSFFQQTFIQSATGSNLDRLLQDFFFLRRQPTHSTVSLSIRGKAGNTVPKGFLASSDTGITFQTLLDVYLVSEDFVGVLAESQETGVQANVPPQSIVNIETGYSFVYAVTNNSASVGGLDLETDDELRQRFFQKGGEITINNLIQGLQGIQGVSRVLVTENATDSQDVVNNLPPHSVEIVVDGGSDLEIGQYILDSTPFGVNYVGDNPVNVVDVSGAVRKIYFSRPTLEDVYITIDIRQVDDSFDSEAFLALAKDILVPYINDFRGDRLLNWVAISLFDGKTDLLNLDIFFSSDSSQKGDVFLNRPSKAIFSTSEDKIKLGDIMKFDGKVS